ncbi:MAG: hypothetical protein GEU82_11090 [Luteitalea sp.]|nr:hypothetical protein [Luteitalea sp.]
MEISTVRRRVQETIDRARRAAAERRQRTDDAARQYDLFLDQVAVPMFKQVASVLKAGGYPFGVMTPGGSVRLTSEKTADDYVELSLDTAGEEPVVMGHSRHSRGRRVREIERPIGVGPVSALTEEQVLDFLMLELEPFVEK